MVHSGSQEIEIKCRIHSEPFSNYCRLALVGAFNKVMVLISVVDFVGHCEHFPKSH